MHRSIASQSFNRFGFAFYDFADFADFAVVFAIVGFAIRALSSSSE